MERNTKNQEWKKSEADIFKDIRKENENKLIKVISNLFELEEEDYFTLVRANSFYSNNYFEIKQIWKLYLILYNNFMKVMEINIKYYHTKNTLTNLSHT